MTILVTGGAGFIGSNFLHNAIDWFTEDIICIDSLTYASDWNNIPDPIRFYTTDISDTHNCEYIFKKHKPKTIFHFAAESHVDNSIKDCTSFINSNIVGTVNLLNLAVKYEVQKFIHISTEEVYGSIESGSFSENSNYNPKNPYSASKASSDHFVSAYNNTYGLPTIITNCSNNYGPRQYTEKLIPKTICNILNNQKIPIYGKGTQVRDWLYVQDHCEALYDVYDRGMVGEKYNIGGECEIQNIDLIKKILDIMGKDESMIEYVKDRLGHDKRYSTSITKIRDNLSWYPRIDLDEGLIKTIEWYERNRNDS